MLTLRFLMQTVQCTCCGGPHYLTECPAVQVVRSCANCAFLHRADNGYSNWTVMDTTAYCLANRHPHDGEELPYDVDSAPAKWLWGQQATQCDWYTNGKGPHTDVDGDDWWEREKMEAIKRAVEEGYGAALAVVLGLYAPQPKENDDEQD